MLTAVHQHFNLRKICDLDLDAKTEDALLHPRPLQDRRAGDPHIVKLKTTAGPLVLFRVRGNGQTYTVTPTPQAAIALANHWSRILPE